MPSPTQWSNADNKQPASWTQIGKTASTFTDDNAKTPTSWNQSTKSPANFQPNVDGREPYLYTDSFKKYVDPTRGYVFIAVAKSPTTWSPVTT